MGAKTLKAYDLAAACYDREPNSVLFTETETVLSLLAPAPGLAILDAACGTGKYAAEALRLGADCAALDFSGEMLARAAARCHGARLLRHDLADLPLPFSDGSFDGIVLAHAIRHLSGLQALFADFARLLRPGGRLVVSVTHPEAPFARFKYLAEDCPVEDVDLSGEKHSHSARDIEEAGSLAGLRPGAAETVRVDDRLRGVLTPEAWNETEDAPLIFIAQFIKP
ncbi:MAG: methyltransferase domain-containing protein [Elusimicrobiales bacterium]|nr:methyltransferase domain-containing protein [Elusimicrobiales bacterium]